MSQIFPKIAKSGARLIHKFSLPFLQRLVKLWPELGLAVIVIKINKRKNK
jgi:hypothetical protein